MNSDELLRENRALRERLSLLSEASRRITQDLEPNAVLQGVVDGARALTGAGTAGITALDERGQLWEFVTSGLTPEERRLALELPGGLQFFAYLSGLPEPLRVADFSAYARAAGLPDIGPPLGPVGTFLRMPIRLLGRHVGDIYLAGKEGSGKTGRDEGQEDGEFTQDDEETLALFAAQAALAIANALRYREERRGREYLETLVNTSPVGVAPFNRDSGAMRGKRRLWGRRSRVRASCTWGRWLPLATIPSSGTSTSGCWPALSRRNWLWSLACASCSPSSTPCSSSAQPGGTSLRQSSLLPLDIKHSC